MASTVSATARSSARTASSTGRRRRDARRSRRAGGRRGASHQYRHALPNVACDMNGHGGHHCGGCRRCQLRRRSSCAPSASSSASPPGRPISCTPIGRPSRVTRTGSVIAGRPLTLTHARERRVLHLLGEVALAVLGVVPADRPRASCASDGVSTASNGAEPARSTRRSNPASQSSASPSSRAPSSRPRATQPAGQRFELLELVALDRDAGGARLPHGAEGGGVALARASRANSSRPWPIAESSTAATSSAAGPPARVRGRTRVSQGSSSSRRAGTAPRRGPRR